MLVASVFFATIFCYGTWLNGPGQSVALEWPGSDQAILAIGISFVVLIALAISSLIGRAFKASIVCVLGLIVPFGVSRVRADEGFERKFQVLRPELERAVRWAEGQPESAGHLLKLPSDLQRLAWDGKLEVFKAGQRTWMFFPRYAPPIMIDNQAGYVWSASGQSPYGARNDVFKVRPLGDGWYIYWTT